MISWFALANKRITVLNYNISHATNMTKVKTISKEERYLIGPFMLISRGQSP